MSATDPTPGVFRTYGPAVVAYLLATAVSGAWFWGDSIDYAIEIVRGQPFWEFGHLLWRPLGWPLAVTDALIAAGSETQGAVIVELACISWLSGLGCVIWLRGLMRWAGFNGWPADLAVVGFLFSQTFLNFTQTASSYIPGLAMLLLGCYLLARAAAQEQLSVGTGIGAGAALAAAVGFWFLYVWALPAAVLLPLFLGGFDRTRCLLAVRAGLVCILFISLGYAVPLIALNITSIAGLRAWIAEASHGVAHVSGVSRAAFGFPRSFIHMGQDGVLFKRYLLHDPLNPVSAMDLMRLSLWKLALFYLFLLALAVGLARSPRGGVLGLVAVAAVPTIGFAIAWQGGDLERYLPLYPFLFLAVAGLFGLERVPLVCRALAIVFLAAAVSNVSVMARPVLWREQERLEARVKGLQRRLKPNSRVFILRDELVGLTRNHPLRAKQDALPLEVAATPGLAGNERWRENLSRRILEIWDKGGDVWLERRLLAPAPRPELNWVEGDDPALSWHELSGFFRVLKTDDEVGGADGFLRVIPSPTNREYLTTAANHAAR